MLDLVDTINIHGVVACDECCWWELGRSTIDSANVRRELWALGQEVRGECACLLAVVEGINKCYCWIILLANMLLLAFPSLAVWFKAWLF